ncbi:MAG: aldose 1-epimerase family protein [Armatimonadota bacterium]|nr:MAG: aldose 1-epimerase family protein [Armatimonadota bacterium]
MREKKCSQAAECSVNGIHVCDLLKEGLKAMFGYDRSGVEKRTGHVSQIGGLKPYTLTDGRAAGMRAVDFRTTRGLEFTVLLDRGMDISEARYKGMSLCWRSCAGDAAPAYYDPRGLEWLWTFFGGLLTTCGLTQVGAPTTDEGEELGLHGRISCAPAEKVSYFEEWSGDGLEMKVSGVVREARLFGPHLEMYRTISARGDGAGLVLRDRIVNAGARPAPCMLLYHINAGFPLLSESAELILPTTKAEPRDAEAEKGKEDFAKIHAPVTGYQEKVYFHTMKAGNDGRVTAALINRRLNGGVGLKLRYQSSELPCFTQWKMLGDREYVMGMEPGNCLPMGRAVERADGRLVILEVEQEINAGFELEVVEGEDDLNSLAREAAVGA